MLANGLVMPSRGVMQHSEDVVSGEMELTAGETVLKELEEDK